MITTPRIDGIRQQGCPLDDGGTLVAVVGYDLMSAALWLVKRTGEARCIGSTPPGCPKIDSAFPRAFGDGTARLCMAQADQGGGGATSHLTWIDFPDELPPSSAIVGAGETYTSAPGGYIRVLGTPPTDAQPLDVALAPFGIPAGVRAVHLRLMASAGAAGRRAFVGPTTNEGAMLPCYIQVAGVRAVIEGRRAASAQHSLIVSTPYGLMTEVYLDILGWWE